MAGKKAILWDNDGVLVDTERWFYEANRRVLAAMEVEATWAMFEEISLRRGESLLENLSGLEGSALRELYAERDALYSELLGAEAISIDGMEELLASLAGRITMGIVTSSRRDHFEVIHGRSGLLGHFDFVCVREDYAKAKPHPDGYLLGIERAGIPAGECVAVEDSPRGLEAALGAGLDCVFVTHGAASEPKRIAEARVRHAAGVGELREVLNAMAEG